MATQIIEVPLVRGQDEGVDRTLLDPGTGLRLLQNCRLTRDGRIEARPAYTSIVNDVYISGGGDMYAFDVTTFEGKLVAIGAPSSVSFTPAYPKELYTYLGSTAPAPWKGLFDSGTTYAALPVVQDMEVVWQAPAGFYADSSDVAYANGYVCVAQTNVAATTTRVTVLLDGTPVQTFSIATWRSGRVVACGNVFVLIGRTTGNNVEAYTFDTTAVSSWSGPTTLSGLGGGAITGTTTWDACSVPGSTTDFIVAVPRPGTPRMEVRRYNRTTMGAGTVWTNISVGVLIGNCGICADSTANAVAFAYIPANDVVLYTINLTTGAAISGPTNVIGPATGHANAAGSPALSIVSSTAVAIHCGVGAAAIDSVYSVRVITGHALTTSGTFTNTRLYSKLFNVERSSSLQEPYGFGTVRTGTLSGTGPLFGTVVAGSVSGYLLEGRFNYNVSVYFDEAITGQYHGRSSIVGDGSGLFWGLAGVLDESKLGTANMGTLQLVRMRAGRPNRRQTAEMQGGLYMAGGFVGYYDGVFFVEAGFLDTPTINQTTQGTTGSLTQLATYTYIPVFEWTDAKGRVHRSEPGNPTSVTLTGVNDDVTVGAPAAHTIRNIDYQGSGSLVQLAIYRNVPNDSVFYRVGQVANVTGEAGYADAVSLLDTTGDTALQIRPIIYTQSQKPVVNTAPPPCRFIAAGRDRLIYGGLPDPYLVVVSQLPFPGEPMEATDFSSELAYQARLPEKVTGVSGFGDTYVAFTEEGIYEIPGEGPQRNGTGEFFLPRAIYSDGGCIDWRSIIDTAGGLFFQMAADKIYRLKPTGEIDFVGKRIRDTLQRFPVVRASALCTETQRVAFLVVDSDTAPTNGGILIYDLVHDAWSFDNIGVADGLCEYDGRIAYCAGGLVFLEASAVAVGGTSLPTMDVQTGAMRLFSGLGQGTLCKLGLVGTYLGDCTVEGFISYNDGEDWTSLGQQSVTAANYFNSVTGAAIANGDPFCIIFSPNRREVDRFAVRFVVTNGSANSGGVRLHMLSLEVEGQTHTSRQPARYQR